MRVGRHDRKGRIGTARAGERIGSSGNTLFKGFDVENLADDTRRRHEHLLGLAAQHLGSDVTGLVSGSDAGSSRRCVGVA